MFAAAWPAGQAPLAVTSSKDPSGILAYIRRGRRRPRRSVAASTHGASPTTTRSGSSDAPVLVAGLEEEDNGDNDEEVPSRSAKRSSSRRPCCCGFFPFSNVSKGWHFSYPCPFFLRRALCLTEMRPVLFPTSPRSRVVSGRFARFFHLFCFALK